MTLTQSGDVLLFDQYKITPPYSDGMAQDGPEGAWELGADRSGPFPSSSTQGNCYEDNPSQGSA